MKPPREAPDVAALLKAVMEGTTADVPQLDGVPADDGLLGILRENELLKREIKVAREAAEITADLVVRQFEETEKLLRRFQNANAQRKAVLNAVSQIAIIATDIDGRIIVFNTGAENLLGYRSEEVVRRMTPEAFHVPEELEAARWELEEICGRPLQGMEVFFEAARTWPTLQREWTYRRKDGSLFPVNMSFNALREPDGSVGGVLCTAMDISEKKSSERALRESERKYRLLINNLPNVVFKGYADGSIDFVDDKVEALTGYSKEEFLERRINWFDIVLPSDMERARDEFRRGLKSGKPYIREYRVRAKNGDIIWIQEGGQTILDEEGKIEYVTGAFLDITQRKEAEQARYESEEKYRSMFDSNPNPIFILERDSLRILDANPGAEETYGYDKNELVGQVFTDYGDMEPGEERLQMIKLSQCYEGFKTDKIRQYRKGGRPFYINFRTCPMRYHGQDAIIMAVNDITDMMEKDALLIQAGKMTLLGEMSAGVAHELNQPLNAIKIGNEYLKIMAERREAVPHEDMLQVAGEVTEQVDRAAKIIDRLRAFGRKTDFEKERVDLNDSIEGVLSMIGEQLSLENIAVQLDLEEPLPEVMAHKNRMEQVLFNLITNARDAINHRSDAQERDAERFLSIRSRHLGDRVCVAISDTGVGIAREVRDRIFEPFFTTKEVGKGMGLGLSIIYGIIRDYQGSIEVESEEGQGATFMFSFPLAGG